MFIQQRHECDNEVRCTSMPVSFPRDVLYKAAIRERPTAWALSGETILPSYLPYMAISHVWSDGTGAGAWKDGSVNECLYELFENIARKFHYDGICTKAIRKMQNNYENARITLVHDCFLRNWLWDLRTACFGTIMSPWFGRGWTALELMKSRKVKIIFRGRWGPVIKDLHEEILAKVDESDCALREASLLIQNLRGNITTLNDLLTVLSSRYTSWPKDVAVISAWLVGVPVQERQQEIFKSIVRKLGRIAPGHLFHSAITMSTTFTWCPAKFSGLPLDPAEPLLTICENGHVQGWWRYPSTDPATASTCPIGHPAVPFPGLVQVQFHQKSLIIPKTKEVGCYQYIGAVYFHSEWSKDYQQVEDIVTISSFQDETESHLRATQKETDDSHGIELLTQAHASNSQLSRADRAEMFQRAIWAGDYQAFLNYLEEDILEVPDKLGRRPLHLAAERGHRKIVHNLLYCGIDHSGQCDQGQTALHYAAWGGSVLVIQMLKDRIGQTTKNKEGNTALHMAAQIGFALIVEALRNQYLVDMKGNNGLAPLHFAAINGHFTVVEMLTGVNVDARGDIFGWTPLHCAIDNGNQDIVTLLIHCGAKIDARDTRILRVAGANMVANDNFNWTPFTFAETNSHSQAIELLHAKYSPKVTGKAKFWTPLHCKAVNQERRLSKLLIGSIGHDYVQSTRKRWIPLQFAVEHNLEHTARWLLDASSSSDWPIEYDDHTYIDWDVYPGSKDEESLDSDSSSKFVPSSGSDADIDDTALRVRGAQPNRPWTPMHWAAQKYYPVVLRILLEKNAVVNADGPDSWTPLHFSVYFGHVTASRLSLDAGAHINPKVRSGATPLIMAAVRGHKVVVRMLLEAGARYDERDRRKQTPLFFAVKRRRTAVVELLLEAGASVDMRDHQGQSPLAHACEEGFVHIVELLLKAKANMEFASVEDEFHLPSISVAARYGFKKIVRLLINAGANVDSRDKIWRTPLMHAAVFGHAEIVQLLLEAGAKKDLQATSGRKAIHWAASPHGGSYYHDNILGDDEEMDMVFDNYMNFAKSEYESEEECEEESKEVSKEESKDEEDSIPPSVWASLEPVVRLLLDDGEPVESKGHKESSPLFLAALAGHKEMVPLLLDRGANVNSRNRRGSTPLMAAAISGNEEVTKLLIKGGARDNMKNLWGHTALDISRHIEDGSIDDYEVFSRRPRVRKKVGMAGTAEEPSEESS
ncbi:uncharacterized protein N7483_003600 [Penicillium malachiteum]|uniref:uncharacterized protein n=1 Tax=Penicillium malachiteum TaxID=1324776 RepID=UPI00254975DE|nr:uncharacterized protein N7483_003600 [Penicillium malachiteum]KAJ5729092.1 hypothetical protein N7483_003600 [Penicillium malachiteum]